MKYLALIFTMFLAFGCEKDEEMQEDTKDNIRNIACDYDLGKFTLDSTSLSFNKYAEGEKIYFVDSLQNSLVLNVKKVHRSTHTGSSAKFHYPSPGVRIRYCYKSDILYTTLETIDKSIVFNQSIRTEPTGPIYSERNFSDLFWIFVNYPSLGDTSYSVFQDVINVRTSVNTPFFATVLAEHTVFGRTFKDVRFTKYGNKEASLWFNTIEGIVAFTDESGKLWRFDRVE